MTGHERNNRRVIFLDIDGVLQPTCNQYRFKHDMVALQKELASEYDDSGYLELDKYDVAAVYYDWDKRAVDELKKLLDDTGADIVLSSDWRQTKDLKAMKRLFRIHGLDGYLKELVPSTAQFSDKPDDIPAYLKEHPELYYYCVIDDRYMAMNFPGRFVNAAMFGDRRLTERSRLEAAAILKYGPWWDAAVMEGKWGYPYVKNTDKENILIHDGVEKAIFLDLDGIVSEDREMEEGWKGILEETFRGLKSIVWETDSHIILTGCGRMAYARLCSGDRENGIGSYNCFTEFDRQMKKHRLMISGSTPYLSDGPDSRPDEIRAWLSHRPDVKDYVILDSDNLRTWDEGQKTHLIRIATHNTSHSGDDDMGGMIHCLTMQHAYYAIAILNNDDPE